MTEFVHVMAPKEPSNPFSAKAVKYDQDEARCTKDDPWEPDWEAVVVFHVDSHHDGNEDWSCPNCGLDTSAEDNPCAGAFVTRMLN